MRIHDTLKRFESKATLNGRIEVEIRPHHVTIIQHKFNPTVTVRHFVPLTPEARAWLDAEGSIPDTFGSGAGDGAKWMIQP